MFINKKLNKLYKSKHQLHCENCKSNRFNACFVPYDRYSKLYFICNHCGATSEMCRVLNEAEKPMDWIEIPKFY